MVFPELPLWYTEGQPAGRWYRPTLLSWKNLGRGIRIRSRYSASAWMYRIGVFSQYLRAQKWECSPWQWNSGTVAPCCGFLDLYIKNYSYVQYMNIWCILMYSTFQWSVRRSHFICHIVTSSTVQFQNLQLLQLECLEIWITGPCPCRGVSFARPEMQKMLNDLVPNTSVLVEDWLPLWLEKFQMMLLWWSWTSLQNLKKPTLGKQVWLHVWLEHEWTLFL